VAPDTALQRAFYFVTTQPLSSYNYPTPDGIEVASLNTFMPAGTVFLNLEAIEPIHNYQGVDLIRWGQDGLAALTNTGRIYLLRGPVVVPAELDQNTAATLSSVSSPSVTHGAGNTMITLTGSNFIPGVAVNWNGNDRTTTIVDAAHISVAIPASDLVTAGSATLTATNPGAPASNALTVTIN
jgi:trimeric autotransporter adhesin